MNYGSEKQIEELKQILSGIKSKNYLPFYYVYGNESYFISLILTNLKKSFNDPTGINIKIYDNDNFIYNDVIKYIKNMPFMAEKKMIIFRNVDFLLKKLDDNIFKELTDALYESKNINIVSIFNNEYEDKYEKKYDQNNKILKFIKENGVAFNSKFLDDISASKYLTSYFKKAGLEVDKVFVAYFIRKCGTNLLNLFNSADKLVAYTKDKKNVTKEDIDICIEKKLEDNVFKLIDLINANKYNEAFIFYGEMTSDNINPFSLFANLTNNYQDSLLIKDMVDSGHSFKEICELTNIRDFNVRKYINSNKGVTKDTLLKKLNAITKLQVDYFSGKLPDKLMCEILFS